MNSNKMQKNVERRLLLFYNWIIKIGKGLNINVAKIVNQLYSIENYCMNKILVLLFNCYIRSDLFRDEMIKG